MAARFLGPMLIARLMRRKKMKRSLAEEQKRNPHHLEDNHDETIEH